MASAAGKEEAERIRNADPDLLKEALKQYQGKNEAGEFKMSNDEVEKFSSAFEKPEFRAMLSEYIEEISDPKHRAEQNAYIRELEAKGEVPAGKDPIHPKAGFVVKTHKLKHKDSDIDPTGGKVFVNIVSHERVAEPTSTSETGGVNWKIPHVTGPPRMEQDKKGSTASTYDCCFHPRALAMAERQRAFRDLIVQSAFETVQASYAKYGGGETLARAYHVLRGVDYKTGEPQVMLLARTDDPKIGASELAENITEEEAAASTKPPPSTEANKKKEAPLADATGAAGAAKSTTTKNINSNNRKKKKKKGGASSSSSSSSFGDALKGKLTAAIDEEKAAADAAASAAPRSAVAFGEPSDDVDDLQAAAAADAPPLEQEEEEGEEEEEEEEEEAPPPRKEEAKAPPQRGAASSMINAQKSSKKEKAPVVLSSSSSSSSSTTEEVPVYRITERGYFDMGEHTVDTTEEDARLRRRPREIVVSIELPRCVNATGVDLDVAEKTLTLSAPTPTDGRRGYSLEARLPYAVDGTKGGAKFDRKTHVLAVTVPVLPPPKRNLAAATTSSLDGSVTPSTSSAGALVKEVPSPQGSSSSGGAEEAGTEPPPAAAAAKKKTKKKAAAAAHSRWLEEDRAEPGRRDFASTEAPRPSTEAPMPQATVGETPGPPPAVVHRSSAEDAPRREERAGAAASSFVASPQFDGARPGFIFKKGPRGLGYYYDEDPRAATSPPAVAAGAVEGPSVPPLEARQQRETVSVIVAVAGVDTSSVHIAYGGDTAVELRFRTATEDYAALLHVATPVNAAKTRVDVADRNLCLVLSKKTAGLVAAAADDDNPLVRVEPLLSTTLPSRRHDGPQQQQRPDAPPPKAPPRQIPKAKAKAGEVDVDEPPRPPPAPKAKPPPQAVAPITFENNLLFEID